MSDEGFDWHINKKDVELQMLTAGLTRETLEKITNWMDKNIKEEKNDTDGNATSGS